MSDPLRVVTETVLAQARTKGYTLPAEVRQELARAGLDEGLWKDVLALARSSLRFDGDRYWYHAPLSERAAREKGRLDAVSQAVRAILERQRERLDERRGQDRMEFIHPVVLLLDDETEHRVLTRDLSISGVRLIGSRRLLGQKVRLSLPVPGEVAPLAIRLRILWTAQVGDDLFENGGSFVEMER